MKLEWKTCIRAGVTVALVYLFITYWKTLASTAGVVLHAASPLIVGFVIAYAVNILMSFFERHYFPHASNRALIKSRRVVCILISYLSLIGIIGLIVGLIIPELANCVKLLIEKIPPFMEQVSCDLSKYSEVEKVLNDFGAVTQTGSIDWHQLTAKIANWAAGSMDGAVGVVGGVITSTFSTTFNIIMSIIFSIYLLAGKKKICSQLERVARAYCNEKIITKVQYFLSAFNDSFHSFIVGQCLEAVILGSLCFIGLLILRMPYAGMIGALIGFTALIPILGAYIGGAVGFLMIATVSPVQAVVFLIYLVLLQQFEGQFVYPKVVGASIGLPGIWVLAAVTIGASVLGIGGILLFVPLASAVYKLLRNDVDKRNKEQGTGEPEQISQEDTGDGTDD